MKFTIPFSSLEEVYTFFKAGGLNENSLIQFNNADLLEITVDEVDSNGRVLNHGYTFRVRKLF